MRESTLTSHITHIIHTYDVPDVFLRTGIPARTSSIDPQYSHQVVDARARTRCYTLEVLRRVCVCVRRMDGDCGKNKQIDAKITTVCIYIHMYAHRSSRRTLPILYRMVCTHSRAHP